MFKRIVRFFILISIIFSFFMFICMSSYAQTAPLSGECGEALFWSIDPSTETLTISGSGKMKDYFGSGAPWNDHGNSFKTVIIETGVTSIGDYAFYNMDNITSVSIPEGVKSIGWSCFGFCYGLKEIVLPTGLSYIESNAFYECINLESITLPPTLCEIGHASFEGCHKVSDVFISDLAAWCKIQFESSSSNPMSSAKNVYLNGLLLEELVIPDGITAIGAYQFFGCSSLKSVWISDDVINIEDSAFSCCVNLSYLDMGNGVQRIGNDAFYGCAALTDITISDHLTSVGYWVFSGCSSLSSVYASGWEVICQITYATGESNPLFFADTLYVNGVFSSYVMIPQGITSIGDYAFSGYDALLGIVIPQSVKSVGYQTFEACENLQEIIFTGNAPTTELPGISENIALRCFEGTTGWTKTPWSRYNISVYRLFEDVSVSSYYFEPVLWAVLSGITNGVSETTFAPESSCSRGQIVTFLWRAAGSPEPETVDNPFIDLDPSAYYYKAVLWAVENGITTGTGKGKFSPENTCTRGQVATFLWRAKGKPAPADKDNPFRDLDSNAYYYEPILWAVEKGITNGTGNGKFSPENTCTRGQIVTFLYRAYN